MSLHEPMLRLLHALLLGSSLLLGVLLTSSQAQVATTITPDGTLGTAVTQSGALYNITGGTRPANGPNLFHSFDRFTVGTNDTARFSGPSGIVNILSRVTGGQLSLIDGQLQSTIPGANLYLLNPSGVLFGPHASLDISGSFHVSTADFLRFADGAIFSAHVGQNSTLTVAPPAAFGFLGPTPAAITVQGSSLGVSEGKAVSVVGGEIQISGGQLVAPSGRVQIASVASPGEVLASPVEMEPNLQVSALTRLGQLTLSQNALLDVSGNSGGTVLIRSGRLLVDQSSILADTVGNTNGARKGIDIAVTEDMTHTRGGFITAASVGAGDAGNIQITARSLHVDGALIGAGTFMEGRAGDIRIDVGTLMLTNGAVIDSSTFSSGHGGTVRVSATETMTLTGTSPAGNLSGIFANAQGTEGGAGAAGSIVVSAPRIMVSDGAQISSSTSGPGAGGSVMVTASDTLTLAGASPNGLFLSGIFANAQGTEGGAGPAGNIVVSAPRIMVSDGAQIISSTFGPGAGGSVMVTASDTLTLAGTTPLGIFASGILATTEGPEAGAGAAGSIVVSAPHIMVRDGAQINTSTFGPGAGGSVMVTASDTLTLAGASPNGLFLSGILATTEGTQGGAGTAGSIVVSAPRIMVSDGAQISSSTSGPGAGGSVMVTASDTLTLAGASPNGLFLSGIFANAQGTEGGAGAAGSIVVSAPRIMVSDGAQIISSTFGPGAGGSVMVTASDTLTLAGTTPLGIFASGILATTEGPEAGAGAAGSIVVSAPHIMVRDGAQINTSTFGPGAGGSVMVTASDTLTLAGASPNGLFLSGILATTEGAGAAGNIMVSAPLIMVSDGAQLSSSTRGSGRGGTVTVAATEAIAISGQGSGLFSNAFSLGDAGQLVISAPTLTMDDGLIQALADFGSRGNAGGIDVQVGRLTLSGGARLDNSTRSSGRGGTLTVAATDMISIAGRDQEGNPSGLFSQATGSGDAGQLVISAPTLTMDDGLIQALADFGSRGNAGGIDVQVGRLTLSGGAQLDNSTRSSGRGGTLTVAATDMISIAGRDQEGNPSGLFSQATGSGDAGQLVVSAPTLSMQDGRILTSTSGAGRAGDLDVRVGQLALSSGAQISTSTGGSGRGGDLSVMVREAISLAGRQGDFPSGLFSKATASGNAGEIRLQVGRLSMTDGAQINTSTEGSGRGGNLSVMAAEAISLTGRGSELPQTGLFSATDGRGDAGRLVVSTPLLESVGGRILGRTLGDGNGGDIEVRVGQLRLTEGAQIFNGTGLATSAGVMGSDGPGRGGNLTVVATDSLFIAGQDQAGFASGLFSGAQIGRGNAGNVFIATPLLTLDAGGQIQAAVSSLSQGDGGSIEVQVGRLLMSAGAQVSTSTFGSGRGGTVTIAATDQIELRTGGTISSSSSGQGDAGNIVIQAGKLFQSRNGAVTTEAETADGGSIQLTVGSRVELRNSQITATVKSGVGQGGNITIDPQFVVMQGSQVRADAFGGPGGNVRIVAGVFLADPESRVSASSALNIPGTVDIQSPITSISGAIAPLQQEFAPITELLRDRCAGRLREGRVSRFLLGGRDGIPSEPGSLLLSPLMQTDPREDGEPAGTPARTGQVQERAWPVRAGILAGLDAECARWTGQKGTTVGKKP